MRVRQRGAPRGAAAPTGAGGASGRGPHLRLLAWVMVATLLAAGCGRGTGSTVRPVPHSGASAGGRVRRPAGARAAPGPGLHGVPRFSHVFLIVMENLGYGQAVRLPYLARLAARYGVATGYDAVAHPSLPNYLALASGHTWVHNDCWFCYVSADNLAAEAARAGVSWGAYMQGLPRPCWLGPWWPPTRYAGKHDPFRYFLDVRGDPALCAGIRPLSALRLAPALGRGPPPAGRTTARGGGGGVVPGLVWITPNLCNDMHDCAPGVGDAWLRQFVPRILASAAWRQGGVLFITWDEASVADHRGCCGASPGGGHVLTLVVAPGLPAGERVASPYNHYSLLATIEDGLGLPLLGHAATARPLAAFWPSAAARRPGGAARPTPRATSLGRATSTPVGGSGEG